MPFLGTLNPTTPTGADLVSLGDDEFRALKQTLLDSFPGLDTQPWQKDDAVFDDECATWGQTKKQISEIFPVGSVLFTADNVAPTFDGTWERVAEGRFIVGVGTGNDGNVDRTFAAGNTTGEYQHTLTEAELPEHYHQSGVPSSPNFFGVEQPGGNPQRFTGSEPEPDTPITSSVGQDQAHENTPPGFALYCWQRTA